MKSVRDKTIDLYLKYKNEEDGEAKEKAKNEYREEFLKLTVRSKAYTDIIKKFARIISEVNQEALTIVNDMVSEVYANGYNAFVDELEEAGFKING